MAETNKRTTELNQQIELIYQLNNFEREARRALGDLQKLDIKLFEIDQMLDLFHNHIQGSKSSLIKFKKIQIWNQQLDDFQN